MAAPITTAPRGLALGRFCKALAISRGDVLGALAYAQGQHWHDTPSTLEALKGAVAAMDGSADLTMPSALAYDFAELLRAQTLIGRLVGMRRAPFNTRLLGASAGAVAGWIGEALPAVVTSADFDSGTTLSWSTLASISVHTAELVRSSAPSIEVVMAADLARAAAYAADLALVDPTNAGSARVKPASLTYGAQTISSSGVTISAIDHDLGLALKVLTDAEVDLSSAYWLMRPSAAVHLSQLRDAGGYAYPLINAKGGVLMGLNVLTSNAMPAPVGSPSEAIIALVAANEILIADDGQARITVSEQADVQLDSAPSAGAAQVTSLWQHGLAALKAERVINWARRRTGAVSVITGLNF